MQNSLQEQLLKAGLVDKAKLEQTRKKKTKQRRGQQGKSGRNARADEQKPSPAQTHKTTRDRELNQQRDEVRRQREVAAQVRQLVQRHRHPRTPSDDDIPFNFQNKDKIKRLYMSSDTHKLVSDGKLVIVNDNGNFELVPPPIAEKIRARNPSLVIDLPKDDEPAADDPYAEFKVPDDLMW